MPTSESECFELWEGAFADLEDDWRVYVVACDSRRPEVYIIGGWPYDAMANPQCQGAPKVLRVYQANRHPGVSAERRTMVARTAYASMA